MASVSNQRVLHVILCHHAASECDALAEAWVRQAAGDDVLLAHGGREEDFAGIVHRPKLFVADSRLRTIQHVRERQSYSGVLKAVASWDEFQGYAFVYLAEYDYMPLVEDLAGRVKARLVADRADVVGHHLIRVDGTSHAHTLHHLSDPAFLEYWRKLSVREDPSVLLNMIATGSLWRREAWKAVAELPEARHYLELYLPTAVHHLGFRIRGLPDQDRWVMTWADASGMMTKAKQAAAWCLHPVKRWWLG